MIVRDKPGFLELFFVYQGSIAPRVMPQILLVALLSSLVVWLHQRFPDLFPELNTASFGFVGIALSLYLGFRNNACYDRWWEGRQLWGRLLFEGRSLIRLSLAYRGQESERHRAQPASPDSLCRLSARPAARAGPHARGAQVVAPGRK